MSLTIIPEKTGPLEVISYLVACPKKKEALVVDPGGPAPALLERLKQENWRLRWIVNTHGHADHTAGNDYWQEATGAPVIMHRLDWEFFSRPEMQEMARAEGFPPLRRVDLPVEDGHRLPLGLWEATVIHTPGHTPGSICLLFPGHLFTGDTLFVEAAGRTDLPGGSLEALLQSLQQKLLPLPDDTRIWPGHDYGGSASSTLGQEKEHNPYLTDFF
ncbi:MAG: MBL fold metallo-hydrolase [Deltaproteobacteria bacterium]|nr:MBL fold metallo-hydrolase [Deltaproteobacteria bacterium]